MAAATSPATGRTYGVRRVCAIWGVARSSFYDARRQDARPPERPTGRPGPKPAVSDAELLAAIRRDLDRSPWTGEGHRKVWARLRVIDGIRVSRSRVLRIMGENSLLSPHRRPSRPVNDHDGSITTEAPNVMWGADGAVIPTVEDGNVTLFIVAEHWNGEGLGWHVAKHGNRYAAAEALALAVSRVFGSVRADAARGVSLRHDHGSAFMSDYFQNQLKFFGMAPSFAFVRQPETNGVAERFIRTLKEQIVFGRIYHDIEEVRAAVRAYLERYNQHWLLEKNAYRSPAETRRTWMAAAVTTHEAA
jgi:putative transposase